MIFTILLALASESDPPNTVKSCAKTNDEPSLDASVASDEAVAEKFLLVHAEIGAAMGDEFVRLFESAFVEKKLDALARRHLAFFVLAFPAIGSATGLGQAITAF